MRMNIFRQELRMGRKFFAGWLIALVALTYFFAQMYTLLASQMEAFQKLLSNFPKEFAQAFGVELMKLGTILGYFAFILTYILLAASIQALNLGITTLSAEVRDKTADFLYAKPVSRQNILAQKMLAVLAQIVATNLVYLACTYLILTAINAAATPDKPLETGTFFLLGGTMFLMQAIFAAMGLFISSFMRRIRTVLPISMGVVFFFYFLSVLNGTLKITEIGYLTPFAYYDMSKILLDGVYETRFVLLTAALVVGFTGLAWNAYCKKDLPAI